MDALVTSLTTDVTVTTLFAAIAPVAALVGVGILVGFAYTVLRKVVGGLGKGKGKL